MIFASSTKVDKSDFDMHQSKFVQSMTVCKSEVLFDTIAYILHRQPSPEDIKDFTLILGHNSIERLSYKDKVIGKIEFFFSEQDGDNFVHNKITAGFRFIPFIKGGNYKDKINTPIN